MNYSKKPESTKIFQKNEGNISNIINTVYKGKAEEILKNNIPKSINNNTNKSIIYKPPTVNRSSSLIQGKKETNKTHDKINSNTSFLSENTKRGSDINDNTSTVSGHIQTPKRNNSLINESILSTNNYMYKNPMSRNEFESQKKLLYSLMNFNNLTDNKTISTMAAVDTYKEITYEKKEVSTFVNLENLMILEEKISDILSGLDSGKISGNLCVEYWNFLNFTTFNFENYFKDDISKKLINICSLLEFLSIIVTYEFIIHNKLNSCTNDFRQILILAHQNYLILCEYLISKVSCEAFSNVWVHKFQKLINNKLNQKMNSFVHLHYIKKNNEKIISLFSQVFSKHNDNDNILTFNNFLLNIHKVTFSNLNDLFKSKIMIIDNNKGSVPASTISNYEYKEIPYPYLKQKSKKLYSLVLDLDETLIHFKLDLKDPTQGELRIRPGLFEFLDSVSQKFELIIFTAATQDYADPILDAIEGNKKYFDYRLYRHHTIIIDEDFVKDISRIGRDLTKTIIIDNLPQNFRLQVENGIFIKSFFGEDSDDNALIDLIPILKNKPIDIRKSLIKFRDEILKTISSQISSVKI